MANAQLKKVNRQFKKIRRLMQQSNRIGASLSYQERRKMINMNNQRKAENRTKIQLGGLVIKSRITDFLAITPGDDLQLDPAHWEKTAVILGALTEAYEKLQSDKDQSLYEQWALMGSKLLRYGFKKSSE